MSKFRNSHPRPESAMRWIPWLLGVALLVTVVITTLHFSEGREFASMLEKAKPWWVALAFLMQAATYSAQGEVFHGAPCFAGFRKCGFVFSFLPQRDGRDAGR